ncbi:MAG: cytochrome c3 family protein [Peptococcaceae bacterium]|nr:cytochrome c3 family protein [Peptococcaceae bacterium]
MEHDTNDIKGKAKKRIIYNVLTLLFVIAAGTGLFLLLDSEKVQSQNISDYEVEVDIDGLAVLTEDLDPNPHYPSHFGDLDCNQCHLAQEVREIACAECHYFSWMDSLIERNTK